MTKVEKFLAVASVAFMGGVGACAASPASGGEPEYEYVPGISNVTTVCSHGFRVFRVVNGVAAVPGGSSCPHD